MESGLSARVRQTAAGSGVPIPYPADYFTPTTFWLDLRQDVYINVYAGSLVADTQQGTIMVREIDALTSEELSGSGEFETPTLLGPLTLTSVDGNTVAFTYPGGKGTFDLSTDKFTF